MKKLSNKLFYKIAPAKLTAKEIALIGMMIATLEVVKQVLAHIPNVELITLLIIVYSLFWGWKVLYAIAAFVAIECMIWGLGLWSIMYVYIWPLLAVLTVIFRKQKSIWFWSIFSALYGLFFGALCTIPYLFIGGLPMLFAKWISGIPFDLVHCLSNFIVTFILYIPLTETIKRLCKIM